MRGYRVGDSVIYDGVVRRVKVTFFHTNTWGYLDGGYEVVHVSDYPPRVHDPLPIEEIINI